MKYYISKEYSNGETELVFVEDCDEIENYFNDNKHKFKEVALSMRRETDVLNDGNCIVRFKSRESVNFFNSEFCRGVN